MAVNVKYWLIPVQVLLVYSHQHIERESLAETAGSRAGQGGRTAPGSGLSVGPRICSGIAPQLSARAPASLCENTLLPVCFWGPRGAFSTVSAPFHLPHDALLEAPGTGKVGVERPSPAPSPRSKTQRKAAAALPLWPRSQLK